MALRGDHRRRQCNHRPTSTIAHVASAVTHVANAITDIAERSLTSTVRVKNDRLRRGSLQFVDGHTVLGADVNLVDHVDEQSVLDDARECR